MWGIHRITGAWFGVRAGRVSRARASRRRRCLGWGGNVLEVRALLSTYLVIGTGDAGVGVGFIGDLRYAIEKADRDTGDSTILFAPNLYNQTITLKSGFLEIAKPSGTLTILAPGARDLTISGGGQGQDFVIDPISNVVMNGVTVTGAVGWQGGAIYNDGQLTLSHVTITGNTAFGGGGGIENGPYGTLNLIASTVAGNLSSFGDGGGIANSNALTVIRSTISGNVAYGGNGGGIANSGTLTIEDSTLSGNTAVYGSGGGVSNTSALSMFDDTVSGNAADFSGGGLDNEAFPFGTVTLDNTIVAGNSCAQVPHTADVIDDADFDGSHLVGGSDLIGAGDLGTLSQTLVGVDPKLGPLQDNGGPTWTQALLAGSPAIKAGNPSLVPAWMTTDQRGDGYARIAQGKVDLGAFEVQARRLIVFAPAPIPRALLPGEAIIGLTIVPPSPTGIVGRSHIGTAGPATSGA